MRVLVVEDDPKIGSFVSKGLREHAYAVDLCDNGKEAFYLIDNTDYDLAIIDIMLPGQDGLTLVQQLRQIGKTMPVLILSARASVDDRVRGLEAGSDDYLTKPFAFSELLARVQALLRRPNLVGNRDPVKLEMADLVLNLLTRQVERQGQTIELQSKEFSLLEYLMRHPGRVITKTMILEHVWDYHFDPQTNVVDVLVHRLRTKIDKAFEPKLIHTIRGVGYVLKQG